MEKVLKKANVSIKKRLVCMLVCFTFLIILLIIRFAYIQIVHGNDYKKAANMQQSAKRIISPVRGVIYDRNGKELAISASVDTVYVNPQELKVSKTPVDEIAQKLSTIINMEKEVILKKLKNTGTNQPITYQIIIRKIDKDIGQKVRELIKNSKLTGIYIEKENKRYYPDQNLAAQVIGFTGVDNQGLLGLEFQMDKYLKGIPGKILGKVDLAGRELPNEDQNNIDAQDGTNVVLTIDETIQYFAERALQQAIDDYKVLNGGTAIVMDPRNGDVLAMVSKPDFDLNSPFSVDQSSWRNRAVNDTYEPGSTFKAIIAAAGIEEGAIKPESAVDCTPITVQGNTINCWKDGGHGKETFTEAVYNSCNPVFVELSQLLGTTKFFKYVKAFGFNEQTNIELPGEAASIMHVNPTEIDLATASFGQSFQVTPIQMITAYSAIANGGILLKPHLIKELTDSNGNIIQKYDTEIVRNVISKQTSNILKETLEGVVSKGTGINAYVEGYKVAGKTATSQTFVNGIRSKDRFIASFCAFAPADNPQICVLVVLDNPSIYSHAGGIVAGPVAASIIDDSLNYLGVEKKYSDQDKKLLTKEVYVPDLKNKKVGEAKKILMQLGLDAKVIGGGNNDSVIIEQTPVEGIGLPFKSIVILDTSGNTETIFVKMPDLINKTVSEAIKAMNTLGLNIKINGLGTVIIQEIPAGTEVPIGKTVNVQFRYQEVND